MTEPAEVQASARAAPEPLGAQWRTQREQAQDVVVPSGRVLVSCSAPLGGGGLGRHFKEVVDALARREQPTTCISGANRQPDPRARARTPGIALARLLGRLPAPRARGWATRAFFVEFDAYAAQRQPAADHLIAFNGQALAQLRAAKRAGYRSLSLISANSHLRRVVRQHRLAHRQYPLEGSWATQLLKRNLSEYAMVDRIYVASQYTRESFLEEGVPDDLLSLFRFTPDPRYRPDAAPPSSGTFDIVFIGTLYVTKGVPLLVDAVRRLSHRDLRLVLVGGWASRGMRRFIQRAGASDSRISAAPGDPLPQLRKARLCVHPSYEDGFGYAPVEALACGVPVIVSEDTGMKELVDQGQNGLILPTGDLGALTDAIDAAYRREILGG